MSITFLSQLSLAHISIVPPSVYVCGVATMGRIYLLRIPERLGPNVPVAYCDGTGNVLYTVLTPQTRLPLAF